MSTGRCGFPPAVPPHVVGDGGDGGCMERALLPVSYFLSLRFFVIVCGFSGCLSLGFSWLGLALAVQRRSCVRSGLQTRRQQQRFQRCRRRCSRRHLRRLLPAGSWTGVDTIHDVDLDGMGHSRRRRYCVPLASLSPMRCVAFGSRRCDDTTARVRSAPVKQIDSPLESPTVAAVRPPPPRTQPRPCCYQRRQWR